MKFTALLQHRSLLETSPIWWKSFTREGYMFTSERYDGLRWMWHALKKFSFVCAVFSEEEKEKKFLSRFRGVIWGWVVAGSHIPTRERKQKHNKEEICPQPLWDHCFLLSTYVCLEWVISQNQWFCWSHISHETLAKEQKTDKEHKSRVTLYSFFMKRHDHNLEYIRQLFK